MVRTALCSGDQKEEMEEYKDYMIRAVAANAQIRAFAVTARDLTETARKAHNTSPIATAALGRAMSGALMMADMLKGPRDLLTIQIVIDCIIAARHYLEGNLNGCLHILVRIVEGIKYETHLGTAAICCSGWNSAIYGQITLVTSTAGTILNAIETYVIKRFFNILTNLIHSSSQHVVVDIARAFLVESLRAKQGFHLTASHILLTLLVTLTILDVIVHIGYEQMETIVKDLHKAGSIFSISILH